MTEEEFRADLIAAAASRSESRATSFREAFVQEMLDRLRDAGELPDADTCAEAIVGSRGRKLEIDAYAFDEADDSLHLFSAIQHEGSAPPPAMPLAEAREQGFNRLLGVFEQARDGWLTKNIEESRPLWALARRIHTGGRPSALRLNVLTDRSLSDRVREIGQATTKEGVPVTFQIWDLSRLKRVHEALSVRDDLYVDLSHLPEGGVPALPVTARDDDYSAYLLSVPGDALADIYVRYGSRLLEGNVRTFLGRRGNINKGIAATLAKEPKRFFAYNNGIAATASGVTFAESSPRTIISGITDLQIVNGAQTTASLAAMKRDGKLPAAVVAVPMKLSVVAPSVASDLIPLISRYANSQNSVRASDFFANHAFHRRMEEVSRRIFAPAVGSSQVQTHWYYERARGQYLNDQAVLSGAKRDQFARVNPRQQVITKTDLAKIESCFDLVPDVACRGAEKAFTAFAEKVTDDWKDERKRAIYSDDWYRTCVARTILFRATEAIVTKAPWYEGYRAQVVAYATARVAKLAADESGGGTIDFMKIWAAQTAGPVLQRQLLSIAESMMSVLLSPPQAGQNIGEWAKQQACRRRALETEVDVVQGFRGMIIDKEHVRSAKRESSDQQGVSDDLQAQQAVIAKGADYWQQLRLFGQRRNLISAEDSAALAIACGLPRRIPEGWQSRRILAIEERCLEAGFEN